MTYTSCFQYRQKIGQIKQWIFRDKHNKKLVILRPPAFYFSLITLLDLLQKSGKSKFKVINSGDKVETQRKSLSSISISFTQNTKNFQLTKNMFNQNSLTSQSAVALFLSLSQRMKLRFFERCSAILMNFR